MTSTFRSRVDSHAPFGHPECLETLGGHESLAAGQKALGDVTTKEGSASWSDPKAKDAGTKEGDPHHLPAGK